MRHTTMTKNDYPTSDGRPMAETDLHRLLMTDLIFALQEWYADEPTTYVSGNLLLFYEESNKRRHVSPDVMVAFGVGNRIRPNYLLWEENAGPSVVIELTSSSTRNEDTNAKMVLYRDTLRVREYYLFDPYEDYLEPSFQGYRLVSGAYRPMRMVEGRFRSQRLGLFLERDGLHLRFVDPETGERLSTIREMRQSEADAQEQLDEAQQELERTRRENEELRRRLGL